MPRSTNFQALALGVLITSGCQSTVPLYAMKQPIFALGQDDAKLVEVGTSSSAAVGTAGGLTVNFASELSQMRRDRRVLATIADVEKVVVTVKPSGAAEVSQTVLKAAISAGQTSVSFSSLPPGEATVTITAYDASNTGIGTVIKTAMVNAGQITTVDATLQLSPTMVGVPGGGSGPSTGGLTANVTIVDGAKLVGPFPVGDEPNGLTFDEQGNLWVANRGSDSVMKLSPQGQVIGTFPVTEPDNVYSRPNGRMWVRGTTGDSVMPIWDLSGTQVGSATAMWGPDLSFDAQGNGWYAYQLHAARFAPDGSNLNGFMLPYSAGAVAAASNGDAWILSDRAIAFQDAPKIYRVSASGGLLATHLLPDAIGDSAYDIKLDAAGNPWVMSGFGLYRMNSDGSFAGPFGKIGRFMFAPSGDIWIHTLQEVIKLNSAGETLATYAVPEDVFDPFNIGFSMQPEGGLALDADGNLWFAARSHDAVYKLVP